MGHADSVFMKTQSGSTFLAFSMSALVFVTTAFAESPALERSASTDQGVGKPGSGAPAPLGQIDMRADPTSKVHVRSTDSKNSTVAQVQRALKQQGYYGGPVDGDAGIGTRAAISEFKKRNRLPVTAKIDRPLLDALGL